MRVGVIEDRAHRVVGQAGAAVSQHDMEETVPSSR